MIHEVAIGPQQAVQLCSSQRRWSRDVRQLCLQAIGWTDIHLIDELTRDARSDRPYGQRSHQGASVGAEPQAAGCRDTDADSLVGSSLRLMIPGVRYPSRGDGRPALTRSNLPAGSGNGRAEWDSGHLNGRRYLGHTALPRPLNKKGARSLSGVLGSAMAGVPRVGGVPLSPTCHDVCGPSSRLPLAMVAKMEVAEAFDHSSDKDS